MTVSSKVAEPTDLVMLASDVARAAADLVAERRRAGVTVADTKSSAVDVVTEADRASEQLIRTLLLEQRPDDAIMGEEGDDHPGTSGVRWIVDPIDGTVNFLYGIPAYAVSIAAELDGEVVAGVVLNVATRVEYAATRGGGAYCDGEPLRVRANVPMSQRLVSTGFSYQPESRAIQAEALTRLLPRVRDIRRIGSAALDLCDLAAGNVDGYLEEGVNLWDHAAGGLVATEAGAIVTTRPGRWGGVAIVGAPADGHSELTDLIAEIGYFGE